MELLWKHCLFSCKFHIGRDQVFGPALPQYLGFPGGLVGKESACYTGDAGNTGSTPRSGRSLGGGDGNPLPYSGIPLQSPMDRGAWWPTVHGVAKSWTRLSDSKAQQHYSLPSKGYMQVLLVSSMSGSKSGELLIVQGKDQDHWKD